MQKVCIPGLHLSLGIFDRLWNLLEEACKEIDFQCAVEGSSGDTSVEGFRKLCSLKMDIETLQKYHSVLTEMLTFRLLTGSNVTELVESVNVEVAEAQDRILKMVNNYMLNNCLLLTKICADDREDQVGR